MKLTVLAASGGIGGLILDQALAAGHDVTAVVRSPEKLQAYVDQVRIAATDLANPDEGVVEEAISGADAVLSGLGARAQTEAGVATTGTRAAITAMQAAGVQRIVVVSAAPVGTVPSVARPHPPAHDPGDGFFMRHLGAPIARTLFKRQYADLVEMEDLLRASDLDWTIVRPPKLHDKALTASYRTALDQNVRGGFAISRADVAHAMLACLSDPGTVRRVVGMAD